MSSHAARILPPGTPSRKRKEREAYYPLKPTSSAQVAAAPRAAEESVCSNRLLAGYMAFEFLTKGTIFGQKFDPARAEAVPLAGGSVESKRWKVEAEARGVKGHNSYGEVATILKTEGVHIPGIVNPTQLARWIQM